MTRTLYVCLGPECVCQGSQALLRALYVAHAPKCTDGRLLIRASGCRSRCEQAITLGLFPDRLFLRSARPEQAEVILAACLEPTPPSPPWEAALARHWR